MNPNNREILQIALPSIVSNITVPLLGLIDVTIVGHLGAASYIGAIAVGGMLFNIIYWIFGFLRMGTGGMTSQAYGKQDEGEMMRLLTRSLGVGAEVLVSVHPKADCHQQAGILCHECTNCNTFNLHLQSVDQHEAYEDVHDVLRNGDEHRVTGVLHADEPSGEAVQAEHGWCSPDAEAEV